MNKFPIIDFPGYYITEEGKVFHENKELKPEKTKKGYLRIGLQKNCKRYRKLIHVLVAEAFLSKPNNMVQVNHINGNKTDNHVSNLEWITGSENVKHSYIKLKRTPYWLNKNTYIAKPVLQFEKGKQIAEFSSTYEAEKITGIPHGNINKCCKNERQFAGGYQWKYK